MPVEKSVSSASTTSRNLDKENTRGTMDMTGMSVGMMGMRMLIPMILGGIALFFAFAALLRWLWNITIPDLFGHTGRGFG